LLVQAQDGLYAEGGTDSANMMPAHRGMFTEHAARKPQPPRSNAPPRAAAPAGAAAALSPAEQAARASEGEHAAGEYEKAEKTESKLALRDAELEDAADTGASKLLDSYNSAVNGAVDDYAKLSQRVDERSARAFEGLPARSGARSKDFGKSAKTQAARQQRPVRSNVVEPGDPLADQKEVFNRLGVSGSLYGVPREYRHEVDATGGARAVKAHVPAYVRRAAHEAADADYIRERAVPRRPKSAGAPKRYLDNVQKEAKAPLLKVAHGQSLKQIINSAVKSALAKQPNSPLNGFMSEESQDRAEDDAHPMGLTENTFHPATGTSSLSQLSQGGRGRVARGRQPAASSSGGRTESLSSDPAGTLNALELPGVSSHRVQAQAFRSAWHHLDDQIDTIFGPSRAELRRRAARARRERQQRNVLRVQQMARVVAAQGGSRGGLPAAAQQQQALSAHDAAMQAKEREELGELKAEVKKLREKAQVRKLKEQVGKLRQQVLSREQREVLKEEAEDKEGVDEESIKAAFERVDTDGDDTISVDELKAALKDLDLNIPADLLEEVLTAEGIEDADAVDLAGFSDVVKRVEEKLKEDGDRPRVCEDKLRHIFDTFDANHDGAITKDELSEGLADLGVEMSSDQIDALLARMKRKEAADKLAEVPRPSPPCLRVASLSRSLSPRAAPPPPPPSPLPPSRHTCHWLTFKAKADAEAKEEADRKKAAADATVFFLFLSLTLCENRLASYMSTFVCM